MARWGVGVFRAAFERRIDAGDEWPFAALVTDSLGQARAVAA